MTYRYILWGERQDYDDSIAFIVGVYDTEEVAVEILERLNAKIGADWDGLFDDIDCLKSFGGYPAFRTRMILTTAGSLPYATNTPTW